MNAINLDKYLKSLVVDVPCASVDGVVAGDPEAEICSLAVCWMAYQETLVEAAGMGANVVVTHEPTFYDSRDFLGGKYGDPNFSEDSILVNKQNLIHDLKLTIIRCHDVWDYYPVCGVLQSWADFLGLSDCVVENGKYRVYKIKKQSSGEVVQKVLSKVHKLGQKAIGFFGNSDVPVQLLGIGTGCACNPIIFKNMGADMCIAVDDIMTTWTRGEWCRDSGFPTVVVNHNVAEEPGISNLAVHLQNKFTEFTTYYLKQGIPYEIFY